MKSVKADLRAEITSTMRVLCPVLEKVKQGGGSVFAKDRGEVETDKDGCKLVYRGELHLTPCDSDRYLELRRHTEDHRS